MRKEVLKDGEIIALCINLALLGYHCIHVSRADGGWVLRVAET